MKRTRIHTLLASLALLLGGLTLSGADASAADRVTLKDGRVLEGAVTRELNGYVWLKFTEGGVEKEQMFAPGDVASVLRDAPDSAPLTPTIPAEAPKGEPAAEDLAPGGAPAARSSAEAVADAAAASVPPTPVRPGVPRAAVITLGDRENGDMVGMYMTKHQLETALPMLEEELGTDGTGVVVFRITSGGGFLYEISRLSDYIQDEYKKRFRVVAWIDSAISAAAMTAHTMEEIYFTPQGNYGACTGWSGQLVAVKGRGLEEVLQMMEKISGRGGHDPLVMRSMQIQQPLSATIGPDGDVKFFADTDSGEILVNRENEILTFNAVTAEKVKFSRGTAATIEDLTRLMGYQELDWVGAKVNGVTWPVSKAEKWSMAYRKQVKQDEDRTGEYRATYQMQLEAAQSEPKATRGAFVNRARSTFNKMRAMVRNNPNFGLFTFNMPPEQFKDWCDEQERMFRDLMR